MARLTQLLLCFYLTGCSNGDGNVSRTHGQVFATTYQLQIAQPISDLPQIEQDVRNILFQIDSNISSYNRESEISKLNDAGTDWFPLSDTSFFVIAESLRIAEWTNGAFDPTSYSLV
ncbi:MAG: FAD:protein FMN transferase, partial [Pseudomonadota bacterium]